MRSPDRVTCHGREHMMAKIRRARSDAPAKNGDASRFLKIIAGDYAVEAGGICRRSVDDLNPILGVETNRLQRLPNNRRGQIGRVLDGICGIDLARKLELKSVGEQHWRLKLRRGQRPHLNGHIGCNAVRVVIVVGGEADGVITGIRPLIDLARTDVGENQPIAE